MCSLIRWEVEWENNWLEVVEAWTRHSKVHVSCQTHIILSALTKLSQRVFFKLFFFNSIMTPISQSIVTQGLNLNRLQINSYKKGWAGRLCNQYKTIVSYSSLAGTAWYYNVTILSCFFFPSQLQTTTGIHDLGKRTSEEWVQGWTVLSRMAYVNQ